MVVVASSRAALGKGRVLLCGACMDARGLAEAELLAGPSRNKTDDVAIQALAADKVLVF
jgi:uncharacterized protein involved in oxidation of intracellular sulfur